MTPTPQIDQPSTAYRVARQNIITALLNIGYSLSQAIADLNAIEAEARRDAIEGEAAFLPNQPSHRDRDTLLARVRELEAALADLVDAYLDMRHDFGDGSDAIGKARALLSQSSDTARPVEPPTPDERDATIALLLDALAIVHDNDECGNADCIANRALTNTEPAARAYLDPIRDEAVKRAFQRAANEFSMVLSNDPTGPTGDLLPGIRWAIEALRNRAEPRTNSTTSEAEATQRNEPEAE